MGKRSIQHSIYKIYAALECFRSCERASTLIEYALIATVISIIAVASLIAMGGSLNSFLNSANSGLR